MTGTQPGQQPDSSTTRRSPTVSQTQPSQPDQDPPPFPSPGKPNENQPMQDPPVFPERDVELQEDGSTQGESGGDRQPERAGDKTVVFDANRIEK